MTRSTRAAYAAYQHNTLDLNHPRGGEALFLANALLAGHEKWLEEVAKRVLDEGPDHAMVDAAKDLAGQAAERCPKELTLLAHSAHPSVTSDGHQVFDEPPEVPRLTDAELAELHRKIAGPDNPRGPRGEISL